MRFRLLPVLIVMAVLTLGMRLGEIWSGLGGIAVADGDAASSADFVADPFEPVQIAQAQGGDGGAAASAEGGAASGAAGGEPGAAADTVPDGAEDGTTKDLTARDPLSMSEAEIELLQQLANRREELDQRAQKLEQRESLLKAAEKRLEKDISKLETLKADIEQLLVQYDKQQERQVKRLVSIYEKMDPEDAARIFEDMEMKVLLKVIDRMNERRTAPILAEMQPQQAQALTLELAKREDLPVPRE